jgi:hypothetical protein
MVACCFRRLSLDRSGSGGLESAGYFPEWLAVTGGSRRPRADGWRAEAGPGTVWLFSIFPEFSRSRAATRHPSAGGRRFGNSFWFFLVFVLGCFGLVWVWFFF